MKKPAASTPPADLESRSTLLPTDQQPDVSEEQILQFLQLLGKDPTKARFRFFPHKHNPKKREIGARKLVGGDLQDIAHHQRQGRGAYVAIGNSDGKGDSIENITTVPALFAEWDDKSIEWQRSAWQELGLPEPSIQVATGGASIHTYWVLTSPLPRAEWEPLQRRLIKLCGSDPNCKDAARVMRLPGCAYIGPDGTPTAQSTIISATGKRYSAKQILPPEVEKPHSPPPRPSDRGTLPPRDESAILDALKKVPEFHHDEGRRDELLLLALRLWAEVGKDLAQDLLAAHSPSITDLDSYFTTEPTQISQGSFWPFVKERYGVDIRRHDLKPKKTDHATTKKTLPLDFQSLINSLEDGWVRSKDGPPKPSQLSPGDLAGMFQRVGHGLRFNELVLQAEVQTNHGWQLINDADLESAYVLLSQKGWTINQEPLNKAFLHVARQQTTHPVRDYLLCQEQRTDLQPFNLDDVAPRFFRASDPLHVAMVRKWLIGAVARVLKPGCQMDYALVLYSKKQGLHKSTAFEALASEQWHCSNVPDNDKDFLLNVHSCWFFELAEIESVIGRRANGKMKNLITTRSDSFRLPYGKITQKRPRSSVFCGTVNKHEFLRDDTGNRRYWVVPIEGNHKLDLAGLKAARDSIWKAAVIAWRAGELPMLPEELEERSEQQNADHVVSDAWEDMVIAWINGNPIGQHTTARESNLRHVSALKPFTTAEALYSAGLRRSDQIVTADEMRVAKILRKLGYKKEENPARRDGQRVRVWSLAHPAHPDTPRSNRGCATQNLSHCKDSRHPAQPAHPLSEELEGEFQSTCDGDAPKEAQEF